MTLNTEFRIDVAEQDVVDFAADVLALKYAQEFYGADGYVASRLIEAGEQEAAVTPRDGGFTLVPGRGAVAAEQVLFVGVPPLQRFDYLEIRAFARRVLSALAGEAPETTHVAATLHGAGYGLDEIEAFESEIAGFLDAVESGDAPKALERISIIEGNAGRAERLTRALGDLWTPPKKEPTGAVVDIGRAREERLRSAGYASASKEHVFVAMPYRDEMDDVYHYGIQAAVRDAGFLCERADLSSFTGDVLEWVRNRVKSARLVVADLSEPNPNVYLEVGYAWGCGVPTVLLTRDTERLTFDVRGQRCVEYKRIRDLEESLREELRNLADAGAV